MELYLLLFYLAGPRLLSLLEFLTSAPKTYVIKLHRRENPAEGLIQAGRAIELVQEWVLRPERIAKALQNADTAGRHLLALVYLAEERGASETELLAAKEGVAASQAALLLGKLEQEMLLYARQGEGARSYHGFSDLGQIILSSVLPEYWIPPSGTETVHWISYRHIITSHLAHFLSQVQLGAVKVTQSGEMHRKDQQELAGRFGFGERLSASIPAEEVQFLLRFSAQSDLLLQEDGRLYLSDAGKALLHGTRKRVEKRLWEWWTKVRMRGMELAYRHLSELPANPAHIAPLANLLWIFSGNLRKTYQDPKAAFTWENLPKALQEFWLLGLVDFGMVKGRIALARLARGISESPRPSDAPSGPGVEIGDEASDADLAGLPKPVSLPNLESLVPLDAPLDWQRRLELVAIKSNDEYMARFRFTKESVIQGLQCGLAMQEFKELLTWLGYEGPTQRTLLDWASTYASTLFMDALLLKVSDPVRLKELQEIPEFMQLITETIPGYGFVLNRQNKAPVREFLQHFGLVPGDDARREPHFEPVVLESLSGAWDLPVPEAAPTAYREATSTLRTALPSAADKDKGAKEQDLATRLEIIETAIQGEKKLDFSYHASTPRRVTIKPLLLLRHRSPIKLIGIEADTGHRNEYLVDQVKSLRIVD